MVCFESEKVFMYAVKGVIVTGGSDLVSISAQALTCASLMSSTTSSRRNWKG